MYSAIGEYRGYVNDKKKNTNNFISHLTFAKCHWLDWSHQSVYLNVIKMEKKREERGLKLGMLGAILKLSIVALVALRY